MGGISPFFRADFIVFLIMFSRNKMLGANLNFSEKSSEQRVYQNTNTRDKTPMNSVAANLS